MRRWRKSENDYVQMNIYKEVKRSDEGSGCWWSKLRNKKMKKEDERSTHLVWLMTYLEPLHILPYFRGVQRIKHKIELSPHSHYIIKTNKNEMIRILRRSGISWTLEGFLMLFGELKGEGHLSPSWMGSDFGHYRCPPPPALSLVGACRREAERAELVGDLSMP